MKKNAIWTVGLTLFVLGMASCQKTTTKRKLANEWKVYSIETINTQISTNGEVITQTESMTETSITKTNDYLSADGTIHQNSSSYGVVNSHTMTIDKDGTWKEFSDFSYDDSTQLITESSGTWSFVRKNKGDDFKKNERVLFNVLAEKITTNYSNVPEQNEVVTTTYEIGKKMNVFTVTESKNKELTLEMDKNSVGTYNPTNSTLTNSQSVKIVLKQK